MKVLAADPAYTSNADIIAACFTLGYIDDAGPTLDPAVNRGAWWGNRRPARLVTHDLDPRFGDGVDFRALPEDSGIYRAIAFDPPYQAQGGVETSGLAGGGGHLERYGRGKNLPAVDMSSAESVQQLGNDGATECTRVLRVGGFLLWKQCNYVWSGGLWPGTFLSWQHGLSLGLTLVDTFVLVGSPGPQPKRGRCLNCGRALMLRSSGEWSDMRRAKGVNVLACHANMPNIVHTPDPDAKGLQHHAAQNLSTLLVFQKAKATAAPTMF